MLGEDFSNDPSHVCQAVLGAVVSSAFAVVLLQLSGLGLCGHLLLIEPFLLEIDRFAVISRAVSALLVTGVTTAVFVARRLSRLDAATMLRATWR